MTGHPPIFNSVSCHGAGNCPEWMTDGESVIVRNTLNPDVEARFTRDEWIALVAAVRAGGFG